MKFSLKINILLLFVVASGLLGCLQKRVFVDNDYRYSLGFNNYKMYSFIECDRDTSFLCQDIQQAIESQMSARGYEFNAQKANLFVNYSIFYDNFRYKGYDQPQLSEYLSTQGNSSTTYKPVSYNLGKGTLIISLIEAQTSEVVWSGYATGIFNENNSKKNYFKNIVRTIFDEYPLLAGNQKAFSKKESK